MGDVGALVQGQVGIAAAVTPGVEFWQYLAGSGRVAGHGQGGEGIEADAGGLQIVLDLVVPTAGA